MPPFFVEFFRTCVGMPSKRCEIAWTPSSEISGCTTNVNSDSRKILLTGRDWSGRPARGGGEARGRGVPRRLLWGGTRISSRGSTTRWTRGSSVARVEGFDQTFAGAQRSATGGRASTSTSGPGRRSRGARMNTQRMPAHAPVSAGAANESTWVPYALRIATTSTRPRLFTGWFSTSRASRIAPAHVPSTGCPARANASIGS